LLKRTGKFLPVDCRGWVHEYIWSKLHVNLVGIARDEQDIVILTVGALVDTDTWFASGAVTAGALPLLYGMLGL
jgi:hypothetical protein